MKIYKKYYFDAAHYIPNFKEGHKNRKIHGHSYELKVILIGETKKKSGWIMDLDELDLYLNKVLLLVLRLLRHQERQSSI